MDSITCRNDQAKDIHQVLPAATHRWFTGFFFFQTRLSFLFLLLNLNTVGDEMVFKVLFAQPYVQPTE